MKGPQRDYWYETMLYYYIMVRTVLKLIMYACIVIYNMMFIMMYGTRMCAGCLLVG